MPHAELVEVCARLIKYKKENKELLTYILFESGDETYFIENLKIEVTAMFMEVNVKSMHWAKKNDTENTSHHSEIRTVFRIAHHTD